MSDELSRRSRIVKYLVAEFNSNKSLTEKFAVNPGSKSEMDMDYNYPEHLVAERIHMDNFEMELLTCRDHTAFDKTPASSDSEEDSESTAESDSPVDTESIVESKSSDNSDSSMSPESLADSEADKKEELEKNDKAEEQDTPHKWVILQLHGGGYIGAMRRQYKVMAGLYSEVGRGATVLTVDYRVAPEHPFPAALEDAMAAYEWLLEQGYSEEDIVLAGDSAGGGLAMALCHTLKSSWRKLPAGIIAMSPWTDLTASGPSYKENYDKDPVFGNDRSELIFDNPYIGDANPRDPRISPAFGDFTGFPPMLIQVGTDEMLLSDSEIVAAKARSQGVKVRFTKYQGMFHVFQMSGKIIEESRRAWAEVKRFLEEI
ncbi:Acetyl esterase/lipase [Lachnospiraceae bacterium NE2001]|nr:Acetyl esterase/lipase [Lachnospiraceae bacterium NE2001]